MKKYASLDFQAKEVNRENFTIRAVFSTPDVDRHGEVVDQSGWKLENFLKNPVVLWSHDNYNPAIGKVIDIAMVDGNLEGTIQFAAKEYDFANTIFELYAGGFIKAISVGFNNLKSQFDEVTELMTLLVNELYEVSCVNVPANALALAKAKGVDISTIEKRMQIHPEKTEVVEEKKEVIPSDVQDPKIDAIVAAADAIEILSKCESGTIAAAVRRLSSSLDVAPKQTAAVVGSRSSTQYSFGSVNRIIRSLQKGRATSTK